MSLSDFCLMENWWIRKKCLEIIEDINQFEFAIFRSAIAYYAQFDDADATKIIMSM